MRYVFIDTAVCSPIKVTNICLFSGGRSVPLLLLYKYLILIRSWDLLQYSFSSFKEGVLNETISEGK